MALEKDTTTLYSEEFKGWLCLQYGLPFSVIFETVGLTLVDQLYDTHQKIRNQLAFLTPNPLIHLKRYIHMKTGNPYSLICISNRTAVKQEYVETAVFVNNANEIFSRPLKEFNEKFKESI